MAEAIITRAAVRTVLARAHGEYLTPAQICESLGVTHGVTGESWQNVCGVIEEANRLVDLGIANRKPGYWAIPLPRERANG